MHSTKQIQFILQLITSMLYIIVRAVTWWWWETEKYTQMMVASYGLVLDMPLLLLLLYYSLYNSETVGSFVSTVQWALFTHECYSCDSKNRKKRWWKRGRRWRRRGKTKYEHNIRRVCVGVSGLTKLEPPHWIFMYYYSLLIYYIIINLIEIVPKMIPRRRIGRSVVCVCVRVDGIDVASHLNPV